MPPIINKELCSGCGKCVDVCPSDVFWGSVEDEIPTVKYPDECWHESACVMDCPIKGAIRLRIPLPMMIIYK